MDPRPLYGEVSLGPAVVVGEACVFGYPKEARLRAAVEGRCERGRPVRVGAGCMIFNGVVLYEGVEFGDECVVEDRVRVGYDGVVGARSRLLYGAYICDRVRIGIECRVAGFVCDGTWIGARSSVMGELVHEYAQPHQGWWAVDEQPPRIEDDTVVGFGARVVGGVTVGPRSYVAAGAVVTRDVPAEHVVTGVNQFTPAHRWPGTRLRRLIEHWSQAR